MKTLIRESILQYNPCSDAVERFRKHHGDRASFTWEELLQSNTISDVLWLVRRILPTKQAIKICLRFALVGERALQFFEKKYPEDKRPHAAYDLIRRQIAGEKVSYEEASRIRSAAAYAAAAYAAAYAAAAYAAAYADAAYAAAAAADAAAYAAYADAAYAAYAAADAARQKEVDYQKQYLLEVLNDVLETQE